MKKNVLTTSMVIIGMLLLSGCASTSPNAPVQSDKKAKEFIKDKSKSNIYVYRNELYGSAISMPITLNGENVGTTGAKTYLKLTTEPGKQIIISEAESSDMLELTTLKNQNYFVWQEVKMGILSARSKLHLVSEDEGKKGVKDCKLISVK